MINNKILNPNIEKEYVKSFNNYMLNILYPNVVMARDILPSDDNNE